MKNNNYTQQQLDIISQLMGEEETITLEIHVIQNKPWKFTLGGKEALTPLFKRSNEIVDIYPDNFKNDKLSQHMFMDNSFFYYANSIDFINGDRAKHDLKPKRFKMDKIGWITSCKDAREKGWV